MLISSLLSQSRGSNADYDWSFEWVNVVFDPYSYVEGFVNDNGRRFKVVIKIAWLRFRSDRRISEKEAKRLVKKFGYRGSDYPGPSWLYE